MQPADRQFSVGSLSVRVFDTGRALGFAAAQEAAPLIREAIRERGLARLIFSAANSQLDMVESLTSAAGIDWGAGGCVREDLMNLLIEKESTRVMTRSPDSLIPFDAGQPAPEKRDDKAFNCRQEGEANLRAATQVNAVSASSTPPAITPIQLDLFPGRACSLKAKPASRTFAVGHI